MNEHHHESIGRMYTRREILERTALGIGLCAFASACGTPRRMSSSGQYPQSVTEEIQSIDNGASANELAVRGESVQIGTIPPPPRLWRPGDLILGGDRYGPKIVAITSDDGPTGQNGIVMSNHMRDAGLEGLVYYFMVANNLAVFEEEGRQVYERGYGIGNHSLTHATYNPSGIAREIAPAQDIFQAVLGMQPELFRSPGLTRGSVIQYELARLGMANIFTTTNINDWVSPRISSAEIVRNVERTIHPGNILLIHDGGSHQNTLNAMPLMIQSIRNMGYEIVRLEELLASGILQIESRIYQDTRIEIAQSVAEDERISEGDEETITDLITYLETTAKLEPERRELIEQKIAEAKAA